MDESFGRSCGPFAYDAPAVERGVGFFETVLVVGRRAVLWDAHLARLLGTLTRFALPSPGAEAVAKAASAVAVGISEGDQQERALRLSWMAVAPDLDDAASWRLDVSFRAIPESTLARRHGSRAITLSPDFVRDTAGVKSTSYFAAVMGLRHARKSGGDEGLFTAIHQDTGATEYLEGTSTALTVWNGGGWLVSEGSFLPSVTAAALLHGREQPGRLGREEIRYGALLLGSLTKATPIVSLDGEPCNVPAQMREEAEAFNARLVSDEALSRAL